jgi:hypothetical protein
MNEIKNKFNKLISEAFNTASLKNIPPVQVTKVTKVTEETPSDSKELKTHRTFMGELSELIFPLCVTDYFVTNKTTSEDIFNAIEHINLTKEKQFVLFDSEVSEVSPLFLSKSEDFKARIAASRKEKEVKVSDSEPSIKEYSEAKSEELFKELGISSEVTLIKEKILKHFINLNDMTKSSLEGTEDVSGYTLIFLAHQYRSKQHSEKGQRESDAIKWYRQRSNGIAKELNKPELAFADTKIIKQGRGGVSVAIRFIIVPHGTLNEETSNKVAFNMEDSSDSLRITLSVEYSDNFLNDLMSIIGNHNHEKFQEVINMIEVYLENLKDVPEIIEARKYLEDLTSNGEIDVIDLKIRSSGSMGSHEGGLIGNIKKDADMKIIEFDALSRKGIKDTKVFSFSLKASDRKDVGTIQFNEKWKAELTWVFDLCDLNFDKLNWDRHITSGDSDSIMKNMKSYFISIQKSENEKLVKFMFALLDLFAHGHEDSTLISISQSRKDMKVYSTLISEYIRARKIFVSVLDMNDPSSVDTYYKRVEKRKGEAKRGRKPSQDIQQFLLQLTDESDDSFGVLRLVQAHSRRSAAKMDEGRGRPAAEVVFNPYKIVIDDELDDLCKKLSEDLKDETRRKCWSINRIFRRVFLMDKLVIKNENNSKLLGQYKEIIQSFESLLKHYSHDDALHDDEIDYSLIERIKQEQTFNLPDHYSGEYAQIREYMINAKKLDDENKGQLALFYGTVLVYARQKCLKVIQQIENLSSQQLNQSP